MKTETPPTIQELAPAELIDSVLRENRGAFAVVLKYLSSSNPVLCQIMQSAWHSSSNARAWSCLLHCLARRRWTADLSCQHLSPAGLQRLDESIVELFVLDESDAERTAKEAVLMAALKDRNQRLRHAAAFLLGMRGDPAAIPGLKTLLEQGPFEWKLKAVRALGQLRDARCGPVLVQVLAENQDLLHREARRALEMLGPAARPAWQAALNHPDGHIRWHAARGLGDIGDLHTAEILGEGLMDENYAVRWASADVLARMGSVGARATLEVLSRNQLTELFRQAVVHALSGIASQALRRRLRPVLDALSGPAPSVEAPAVAQRLLREWEAPG